VQREPEDARVLLAAAMAAGDTASAERVRGWVGERRLQDARLANLVRAGQQTSDNVSTERRRDVGEEHGGDI
jgi:hypothetical protein